MWPPVLEVGLVEGVWVMEQDPSWMAWCPPHGNEWVLALLVHARAGCLKEASTASSLPCSISHCVTYLPPFVFCHDWKLPEVLTRSRCQHYAPSIAYRTISKINLFPFINYPASDMPLYQCKMDEHNFSWYVLANAALLVHIMSFNRLHLCVLSSRTSWILKHWKMVEADS